MGTWDDVAATLRAWERERDLSGAVLLARGGEVLVEGAYGYADRSAGVRNTTGTRFALASVTKLFTAVAVADLVGRGLLAFDTAVVDVVPAGLRPRTLRGDVTVHHLLCHTSGIADYAEEDEDTPGYVEDYASLWTDVPPSSMLRPRDFLPLYGDREPYRPPGGPWHYSNAGYVLLGEVVEQVTGRPYTDVVADRVLARAGMTASGFFRLDELPPATATGYLTPPPSAAPDAPRRTNVHAVPVLGGADGGAFSTTADLVRFCHALEDGTLLGPLTSTLLARHVEIAPEEEGGLAFGGGYGVLHHADGRWGHGGGDPGVEVILHRWPEEDVDLVVLANQEGLVMEVRDLLVTAWRAAPDGP